jgi:hypothetical protein
MEQWVQKLTDGFDVFFHVKRTENFQFFLDEGPQRKIFGFDFAPEIQFLQVRRRNEFIDGLDFFLFLKMIG